MGVSESDSIVLEYVQTWECHYSQFSNDEIKITARHQ